MAFPEAVKDRAFSRSYGQCECKRSGCPRPHVGRCPTKLSPHGAEYHHIIAEAEGGSNELFNCEVLCDACYEGTQP
jgi:5-methylcytosine-specific restriction endonuclease McrA